MNHRFTILLTAILAACGSGPEAAPGAEPATPGAVPAPGGAGAVADARTDPDAPVSSPASPASATAAPSAGGSQPAAGSASPPARPPAAAPGGGSAAGQAGATAGAQAGSSTGAQDEGAAILRAASRAYDDIASLQADFVMHHQNPLLRTSATSRGTLYQRRPDRILLRFTEPQGDVIVGDGTHFWVYYPSIDGEQVVKAPASQAGTGGVDLQAQFVGDPVERFRYTVDGQESVAGRPAHVLTLVPRGEAGYDRLKVWVDARDALVRRFEITEETGAVRRFDLSNLRINPELGDALFRFTPPAGVRVVERRS